MNFVESIFLGLLQGATEFLPISSSGHLFLAQEFMGFTPNLNLEIWLHGASLLAVILFFWPKIWEIIKKVCTTPKSDTAQFGFKLLLSTICTIPIAITIEPYFKDFLTTKTVAITLIITGFIILFAEKFRGKNEIPFTWWGAIALGIVQGVSVIPGISRSGITIAFLILLGLNRKNAAETSFLLAIPTILGALVFAISDVGITHFVADKTLIYGFVAAFVASLLAINWMMELVKGKWIWFSGYCLVLGGGLIFYFW